MQAHNPLQLRQSQLIFRPDNHQKVMPAYWGHVSYPIDSLTAMGIGLCSSLVIAHLKEDWHTYNRHNSCDFDKPSFNPLCAKFFRRNKSMYSHFISMLIEQFYFVISDKV